MEDHSIADYIIRRIISIIPVLLGISIITFVLLDLIPGDAATAILSEGSGKISMQDLTELRKEMGIYDSIFRRYIDWISHVIRLDFGTSYQSKRPVIKEISSRFLPTLELACFSMLLTIMFSFLMGILAAIHHNKLIDHILRIWSLICVSTPGFWIALLFIYIFSVKLKILPTGGYGSFKNLILPGMTLSLGMSASYARLLRASMLEVLGQEYINIARAKGLKEWKVICRHALRNAMLPLITMTGISFANLLSGTIIIESIFSWPGIGSYCLKAIVKRDYPVVQGYVLLTAVIFVFVNLIVDILYQIIDPRVKVYGNG